MLRILYPQKMWLFLLFKASGSYCDGDYGMELLEEHNKYRQLHNAQPLELDVEVCVCVGETGRGHKKK